MLRTVIFVALLLKSFQTGAQSGDWVRYFQQTNESFIGPQNFIDSLHTIPGTLAKEIIGQLEQKHGNTSRIMLLKAIHAREHGGGYYAGTDWRTWWSRVLESSTHTEDAGTLFAGFFYFGDLYNGMQNADTSTFYLLKAADIAREARYPASRETNLWILVSHALYKTRNYRECADFCLESLADTASKEPLVIIAILNNLGLSYKHIAQHDSAQYYFRAAADYALRKDIKVWWSIATGNIGDALYEQGREDEAVPYWKTDYDSSMKYNEPLNALLSGTYLSRYEFKKGNRQKAVAEARTAFEKSKGSSYVNELAISEILGNFYLTLGRSDSATYFLDFHHRLKDSLTAVNQRNNYSFLKLKLDFENSQQSAESLLRKNKKEVLRRNLLLISLIVLSLLSVWLVNRERKKTLQEKRQKAIAEKKATSASKEMDRFTKILSEKEEQIEDLSESLDQQQQLEAQKDLIHHTLLTDHEWLNFKTLFEKSHPGFIAKLKGTAPDITAAEIRLAVLIRLNLGNKEMAAMQGVSMGAIRVTKTRLRARLNLATTDNLETFIHAL